MYALGILSYAIVCGTIAWLLANLFTRQVDSNWPRWVVAALLAPVVAFLPFADEIVGCFQFERLCEESKDVKIHGTIAVGEELYTPDGKWRIGLREGNWDLRMDDWQRAQKALDSYVRWDFGSSVAQEVPNAAIAIRRNERRLFDASSGRLLAEWRDYGTRGGWISRNFESPIIVRSGCGPDVRQVQQTVLKFAKSSETAK
jgi:hypothetical protein